MSQYKNRLPSVTLIQKESLLISMTIRDSKMETVDVSSATLQLTVKPSKDDTSYSITVEDSDFDKSDGTNGVVTFPLTATDLDLSGEYWGLLKITFSTGYIKKVYFKVNVEASEE